MIYQVPKVAMGEGKNYTSVTVYMFYKVHYDKQNSCTVPVIKKYDGCIWCKHSHPINLSSMTSEFI